MVTSHSPPFTSIPAEADVIAAARALVPQVRAAREDCERLRRVPSAMAEALAKTGLLQMYLPRSMGGPEQPPLVVFRAVEEISRADGSIGWCTMIATAASNLMSRLEPEVGRCMAGAPADVRLAGSIRPQGRAACRGRPSHRGPLEFREWGDPRDLADVPVRALGRRQAGARTVRRAGDANILGAGSRRRDCGHLARAGAAWVEQPRLHACRPVRPRPPFGFPD